MTGEQSEPDPLIRDVRQIALALPGADEYVMVHHPAFRVGKKPFAIVGMEAHVRGATLCINFGRDLQHQLLDDARFTKTPYLGQHGWVTIAGRDLRAGELSALLVESWRRVAGRKLQAAYAAASGAKPVSR